MRKIMVLNAKGGTGKTTLATNLSSYYASQGVAVTIKDFDPQASSMDWLAMRDPSLQSIHGLAAFKASRQFTTQAWQMRLPANTERLIIDTAASIDLAKLTRELKDTDCIIIPVSASAIEVRATINFIHELQKQIRSCGAQAKLGIVANRVNADSVSYHSMQQSFSEIGMSLIASLSHDEIYLKSAESGIGVLEMRHSQLAKDKLEWAPLINWVEDEMLLQQNPQERKLYVVTD